MNRTSKFPPGLYHMRNGECAELLAERNGFFYGTGVVNTTAFQWFPNGNHVGSDGYDLLHPWIEPRKPFEGWVNSYEGGRWSELHLRKEDADLNAHSSRIGPAIRMIEATPLTDAAGEMYEALNSIAANTCCNGCLEAARVARAALAKAKP